MIGACRNMIAAPIRSRSFTRQYGTAAAPAAGRPPRRPDEEPARRRTVPIARLPEYIGW